MPFHFTSFCVMVDLDGDGDRDEIRDTAFLVYKLGLEVPSGFATCYPSAAWVLNWAVCSKSVSLVYAWMGWVGLGFITPFNIHTSVLHSILIHLFEAYPK